MDRLETLSVEVKKMMGELDVIVSRNINSVLLELVLKGEMTPGEYEWAKLKILNGIWLRKVVK